MGLIEAFKMNLALQNVNDFIEQKFNSQSKACKMPADLILGNSPLVLCLRGPGIESSIHLFF